MLAVWWAWHDAVFDLRRDAVRDLWWRREAIQLEFCSFFCLFFLSASSREMINFVYGRKQFLYVF